MTVEDKKCPVFADGEECGHPTLCKGPTHDTKIKAEIDRLSSELVNLDSLGGSS